MCPDATGGRKKLGEGKVEIEATKVTQDVSRRRRKWERFVRGVFRFSKQCEPGALASTSADSWLCILRERRVASLLRITYVSGLASNFNYILASTYYNTSS